MTESTGSRKISSENYPGNSHKQRESAKKETKAKPKVEKIITGEAKQRKKGLGRKVAENFAGDDMGNVGNYLLFEVLIPAAKSMISDAASQGVERMLFGESVRRPSASSPRPKYTNYTSYSRSTPTREEPSYSPRTMSQRSRGSHDFDEIVIGTRGEAEGVIERLNDLIDEYDVATVSDLYDLVGITGSFTDDKWGWTDLRAAGVTRIREGYLLDLPKTSPLD